MQKFRVFDELNLPELSHLATFKGRYHRSLETLGASDRLSHRLLLQLIQQRAVLVKEIFEAFEFFVRVHKKVRRPEIADICCGHGLVGVLFALFERQVERVTLIDRRRPASFDTVLSCAVAVGPWVQEKIRFQRAKLTDAVSLLNPGTGVVAVHACGHRTDGCLDTAIALGGPVAVLPCCYSDRRCPAPPALRQSLGTPLATDVDRTYRLEAAGYRVRWSSIPEAISPMHRILLATPR